MVVKVGDSVHRIDYEKNLVGLLDCKLNLLVDFGFEDIVGVHHPAAGVDDREFLSGPVDLSILAVAGGAGGVVDNGCACLSKAVEERGLAHVGAPHYCYHLSHVWLRL